jgi:hypothetical protein
LGRWQVSGIERRLIVTNPIIIRARQIFVERIKPGRARERGALGGAYDEGTDIQQFMKEAEEQLLRERPETVEE